MNIANLVDTTELKKIKGLNAILLAGQAGNATGNIVADVVLGKSIPSGKLTDTWAASYEDYPSSKNFSHNNGDTNDEYYSDGIYVGYRYFETFAPEKVMYEFGFGLSYTEFSMETVKAESTGNGKDAKIALSIRVKNTGEAAGKEAAQVYVSAPQGQLGKPAKVLCGFAKTKLLAPGEEEVLELTIPVSRFASYDDSGVTGHKSCYVLEEGLYKIYVGNSVRCTEKSQCGRKRRL